MANSLSRHFGSGEEERRSTKRKTKISILCLVWPGKTRRTNTEIEKVYLRFDLVPRRRSGFEMQQDDRRSRLDLAGHCGNLTTATVTTITTFRLKEREEWRKLRLRLRRLSVCLFVSRNQHGLKKRPRPHCFEVYEDFYFVFCVFFFSFDWLLGLARPVARSWQHACRRKVHSVGKIGAYCAKKVEHAGLYARLHDHDVDVDLEKWGKWSVKWSASGQASRAWTGLLKVDLLSPSE